MRQNEISAQSVRARIQESHQVLVGLGLEWQNAPRECYDRLAAMLEGKNYYIITTVTSMTYQESALRQDRIAAPFSGEGKRPEEDYQQEWERYTLWLTGMRGKSLLLLELGVYFDHPDVIRFPFERFCEIGQRTCLIRMNELFPQLTERLQDRAFRVKINSAEWIRQEVAYDSDH